MNHFAGLDVSVKETSGHSNFLFWTTVGVDLYVPNVRERSRGIRSAPVNSTAQISNTATGVSERSFFFAALRADQNRIVRCAADSDRASNTSRPCSRSCLEGGRHPGRLRMIIVVVDQLSQAALQATIRPSSRSLLINGSIASIFTVDMNDSVASTWVYSRASAN